MKKVKASAIYYALFLSIIFGLILGGLLLFSGFNQRFALLMDVEETLIDNARSGIAYGQANFKELPFYEPVSIRLFGSGIDSVNLTKKQWGAFTVLQSEAVHRNRSYTKIALLGGKGVNSDLVNLYLADHGRPISLCGDARIEGSCYLPRSGLKRAYIEGKSYQGTKMVYGSVQNAEKQLPQLSTDFITGIGLKQAKFKPWDENTDSIRISFAGEGEHYVHDNIVSLDNIVLHGQVTLEVKDSIFVGQNAVIENAILKSKIVYIESGFSGTVQIFASEKIVLEEAVQLKYPSVLGLIETETPNGNPSQIVLAEGSQVIGAVFLWGEDLNFRMLPTLSIADQAEIDGMVYCAGKTQLRGTINGSLYANKLFLKTASSAYENHLLDGQLLNQLPESFVSVNLLEDNQQLKKIAWLQ